MSLLKIAPGLELPLEAVTQTFAILAKRGAGKSYTAMVMVEEMLKNNLHVVCVDPIGVFWGLRSSADGKRAGLPIVIAGGEHADVPIEPTSGEVLAEMIVEQRVSMVIDLSLFRKGEQHRFMIDFAETLYRKNRQAVHLVLDEADEFAPQRTLGDEARMLGAIEDLVRRGRARGIGVTMITQRPAVLNKNVLTQIEVLVALRLTSPQDRAAIAEWVKYHADNAEAQQMLESLGSLPIGTAWFWSPGWLNLFKKVAIRKRETLDSSSTPKAGEQVIAPQKFAAVDLEKIREKLAATITKVESEDPKALRRRIVELEKGLKMPEVRVEVHEIEVVPQDIRDSIDSLLSNVAILELNLKSVSDKLDKLPTAKGERFREIQQQVKAGTISDHAAAAAVAFDPANGAKPLSLAARSILNVLAQYPLGRNKPQLSILSGYTIKSSSFSKALSELRTAGYINSGEPIKITEAGSTAAGDIDKIPIGKELVTYWLARLGKVAATILQVLIDAYPRSLDYGYIAERSGYSEKSSSFSKAISKLRSLQLAEGYGTVKASDIFFEEEVKL